MGFFSKLFSGISKAASTVVSAASKVVEKTIEIASAAADAFIDAAKDAAEWAAEKLASKNYNSGSVESRKGVEQALATFRAEIREQANNAEETSIYSAMSRFDEFAEMLEGSFPELVALVRKRQSEAEDILTNTIINYVQEHISENDSEFEKILKMPPGEGKKREMSVRMQSIIDDAQEHFGSQLKQQIRLLNDELNVRINQKIRAQEEQLEETERRYRLLSEQQASEALDIQKLEEECVPIKEAAICIQVILGQEESHELLVRNRSFRSKRSRKSHAAN